MTARSFDNIKKAAQKLLSVKHSDSEDAIRQNVSRLLDALEIDNIMAYRTPEGPADIYLPQRRVIIETKSVGLADDPDLRQPREGGETPREQLERYLQSERREEEKLSIADPGQDHPWTGILTDGRLWHAWRYDARTGKVEQEPLRDFRPGSEIDLLARLRPYLEGEKVGKPWIPADSRNLFDPWRRELQAVYEGLRGQRESETRTKMRLWLEMLRTSNMEPENEASTHRLFVTHSFLVSLARGVIHTLGKPNRKPDPGKLLGDGFVAWILSGVRGAQWAKEFLDLIHGYEWRRRPGDVLRPLYEEFVGERERKDFGEYYTPDWLAELMVDEILDDEWCRDSVEASIEADGNPDALSGKGVLDPACGSGTFLYHAVRRILGSEALDRQKLDGVGQARIVARLVNGIDVHPVAGEIARATVLRALPAEPPGGAAAIRIYEGDSLLVRSQDNALFQPLNGEVRFETPMGQEVFLPRSFVNHQEFAELLRRLVQTALAENPIPLDIRNSVPEEDRERMEAARDQFTGIIKEEGNSVWVWYIVNTTGPLRLKERKVDRIVANPPWITVSGIQAEGRKEALEQFAREQVGIWGGGKVAPHLDIAQIFVKRCRNLYLTSPESDPAAWLVKAAAMKSEGWSKFRKWHAGILAQTLNLQDVRPFGGGDARRCCVLFDHRPSAKLVEGNATELCATVRKERPRADMTSEEALRLLDIRPAAASFPQEASGYCDRSGEPLFRQGATITPKVLTVVGRIHTDRRRKRWRVTTVRSDKKPWSDIKEQSGEFPAEWLRCMLSSGNLFPFAVMPVERLLQAIVPVSRSGDSRLISDPSSVAEAWRRFDAIYQEHRGKGRYTPKTLINQIDYGGKLTSQLKPVGRIRTLVLHPSSGDIMRAARMVSGQAVIDSNVYYYKARSATEAAYLVGILNAPILNAAIVESRTSGRHFHKNPWRKVPVPRFDPRNAFHQTIANLAIRAEKMASRQLADHSASGQVATSKRIRQTLAEDGILDSLNEATRHILPCHVSGKAIS